MGYRLGVDLGTTFTAAVVHRPGSAPTVVPLGDRSAAMPSVLYLGADGTVLIGEAAERRALTDPDRVVRRFKRRIGDETPLLFGAHQGEAFTAHAVAARIIALVADRVVEREGCAPDEIAITVPATWGPHKKDLLSAALTREGLLDAMLVSEPAAAAVAYAHAGRLTAGTTLAVYDFGGGTFDAALLHTEPDGRSTLLGSPAGLPDLGGIDFDDAVLAHVLASAGPQVPAFDGDDPDAVTTMARLRRECVDAKEGLSVDTAVTVPVLLGGLSTSVRLTRREFEAMIVAGVEETFASLDLALESAGLAPHELRRVLLTGGSSRIPLVTQLLSARYPGARIERDIDPKLAVATGAVLALELAPQGRHAAPATPAIVPPAEDLAPVPLPPTAGVSASMVLAGSAERPQRPPLEHEEFEGESAHFDAAAPLVRQRARLSSPVVLSLAAGALLLGGIAVTTLLPNAAGDALPAATLQEKEVGGRAPEKSADRAAEGTVEKSEATQSTTQSGSGSIAGGRTEGSADTQATGSDSAPADGSTAEESSTESEESSEASTKASKSGKSDQAAADRSAAKQRSDDRAGAGTPASGGTAATASDQESAGGPAPADTASGGGGVGPAAAVEDTSTDSGSVESFNDGSGDTTGPADSPPPGP